jgi:signal transduction histidine kinase
MSPYRDRHPTWCYRVDPARGGEEGTGLGLAIANWIAGARGADVRVISTGQAGTGIGGGPG